VAKTKLKYISLKLFFSFVCFFSTQAFSQGYGYSSDRNIYSSGPSNNSQPEITKGVTIEERLGSKIDLNLKFTNQDGKLVTLKELTKDNKPFILTLNYYRCTTLCGIQLFNLSKTIKELGWRIGKDYSIATISFDPTDTPDLAKKKQQEYLSLAHQPQGEWNFFVGDAQSIQTITKSVGFFYKYIPQKKEFSHTAALFFIGPDGTVTRYLYGISYKPNDVKFAIMDASINKVGSTVDRFLLFCCNYDPNAGAYTGLAMGMMRVVGGIGILILGSIMLFYFLRERKKSC
jgi:protein SCO1/2